MKKVGGVEEPVLKEEDLAERVDLRNPFSLLKIFQFLLVVWRILERLCWMIL